MDKVNIEISNVKKHFFPTIFEEKEPKKYKNKMVNTNFYAVNELTISNQIKQIPNYYKYFLIIEEHENINIRRLNDKTIEKLNTKVDEKYLLYKYSNKHVIDFNDFLLSFTNPKLFILHIFQSFSYVLKGLIQLNTHNICFFNLSPENIKFIHCCREKPLLQHFQLSLNTDGKTLNEEYITNILKKDGLDFTHKPLEVHLLFYLVQNNMSTISYSFIEEICEIFITNMCLFKLFSAKFRENYKKSCIESLKKYINKPRQFIVADILTHNDKWDIYSLSIIYLHIIGTIIRIFSLTKTFLNKLTTELLKNIHPEPSKRESLKNMEVIVYTLFNSECNWSFVNDLKYNKIEECIRCLFE
jgi:hypothetical protein